MNIIILTGTSDQTFHVREIPANNIIHVTDSLAVRQTRQNTSLFFQHTSQSIFVTDFVSQSIKTKSEHSGSVRRVFVNISEGKVFENKVTDVHASMLKIK